MGLALQNEHKVQQVICIYFITKYRGVPDCSVQWSFLLAKDKM